jgi:hypothetical protein
MKNLFTLKSVLSPVAVALLLLATDAQSAPGDLYVAEATGGGHIYKFTPAGSKSTFASGIYQPIALAFDRGGNLFVGNSGAGTSPMPSTIIRIAPDGTQKTFATIQSHQLLGLAFDGASNLFVSTGSRILQIAPDGTQSTFASSVPGVWPLAFDKSGNLYAGVNPIGPGSILKFAADGSRTTFVTFSDPGSGVTALAFDLSGNLFAERGDFILKISPNGNFATFASGNFHTSSLAFDAAGNLFAGLNAFNANDPAILKFTPGGMATTFASGVLSPSAFAFEPVTEKLRNLSARGLVSNTENAQLIGGFIVGGNALASNAVVVRALGPSLSGGGVSNSLSNPMLELHDSSGAIVAENNDWQDAQATQITASGLAPADPRESAIYATLPAGDYTAVVRSSDQATGIALVEVYSVNK